MYFLCVHNSKYKLFPLSAKLTNLIAKSFTSFGYSVAWY